MMATIKQTFGDYVQRLRAVYSANEATIVAEWVWEAVAGLNRQALHLQGEAELSLAAETALASKLTELLAHRPVQYVVGEALFYNRKWTVNENVLVPRPETEELVGMVEQGIGNLALGERDAGYRMLDVGMPEGPSTVNRQLSTTNRIPVNGQRPTILDIGTGSGCIAITLQKLLPRALVTAVDVSEGALSVARQNAAAHGAAVEFVQLDFLEKDHWHLLGQYNAIVSNPPYIPLAEKQLLDTNVVAYEPGLALFVPDNDPLVFYQAIAEFGLQHLKPGGFIAVETHEQYAQQVAALFAERYSKVEVRRDVFGKERNVMIG
jgi:release factor glutamine methyltransferase